VTRESALKHAVLRQKLVRLVRRHPGSAGARPRAGPETGDGHPHAAEPSMDAPDSRWVEGERAGDAGPVSTFSGTEDRGC
jgi:hypothetical protein